MRALLGSGLVTRAASSTLATGTEVAAALNTIITGTAIGTAIVTAGVTTTTIIVRPRT
jgi:hypothetical protein